MRRVETASSLRDHFRVEFCRAVAWFDNNERGAR